MHPALSSGPMSLRLAAYVVVPVVLVAAGWVLHAAERPADTTPVPVAASSALTGGAEAQPWGASLPPNHPPIGGTPSPQAPLASAPDDPPALAWRTPDAWLEAPSPSTMRLATYRVPGGVEVSISRAGGATEANLQRWTSQFDDIGHEARAEKTVHGLHVVTVDVAGTYVGGGTAMGGPAEPRHDWALVGAIVETRGSPYFFKMTGPAGAVRAARPAFDKLVASIAPT
jgi:hypothetical protein